MVRRTSTQEIRREKGIRCKFGAVPAAVNLINRDSTITTATTLLGGKALSQEEARRPAICFDLFSAREVAVVDGKLFVRTIVSYIHYISSTVLIRFRLMI